MSRDPCRAALLALLAMGVQVSCLSAATPAVAQATSTRIEPAATPAPPGARLYIIAPKDGARLSGPFVVQFGLSNMGVTQAGSMAPNAGHHHLLVDVADPIDPAEIIPADKNHIHYGGGQTEARLDLAPGRHTLQLVLGDAQHRPFRPIVVSDRITVTVLDPDRPRKRKRRVRSY